MKRLLIIFLAGVIYSLSLFGQEVLLEGYVFESGNRGYLNAVLIKIKEQGTLRLVKETYTNMEGNFSTSLPSGKYLVVAEKDLFHPLETPFSIDNSKRKEYIKLELYRKPGYVFDATLAEKSTKDGKQADAIVGAKIEMYNNTTQQPILELDDHPVPTFKMNFERGNHYTIMIRKQGYFTKRLEAYVDVKGCILCFDGVGDVRPDVSDVLTEQNKMGTLLANIELQPLILNEGFELKNIYYDLNSAALRPEATKELDALVTVLKDNPGISVELGSHTDARGKDEYNLQLSQQRAQSVVDYLYTAGKIEPDRLIAKGYGETQLMNNCKNGVTCSEEDHQKNRRTELKVTSIEQENIYSDLRLAEIIQMENLSSEIIEVGQDGQIIVQTGGTIPEDIRRDIQKAKEREQAEDTSSSYSQQNKVEATPVKEDYSIVRERTNTDSHTASTTKAETITKETPSNETETSSKYASPIAAYKEQLAKENQTDATSVPKTTTNSQVSAGETLVKVAKNNKKTSATSSANTTPTQIKSNESNSTIPSRTTNPSTSDKDTKTGESMVQNARKTGKTKPVDNIFTGYLIEFLLANEPVTSDHPVFSRHGNIFLDKRPSGEYSYLLGSFKEKQNAIVFLKETLLLRYPTAKLVRYEQGKRTGYEEFSIGKKEAFPPR